MAILHVSEGVCHLEEDEEEEISEKFEEVIGEHCRILAPWAGLGVQITSESE